MVSDSRLTPPRCEPAGRLYLKRRLGRRPPRDTIATVIEVRATTPEELRAAAGMVSTALLQAPHDDAGWEKSGAELERLRLALGLGWRSVASAMPAVTASRRWCPAAPGCATSAVSRVGVLATHRRAGVGRRLMTQLLDEARAAGQRLAPAGQRSGDLCPLRVRRRRRGVRDHARCPHRPSDRGRRSDRIGAPPRRRARSWTWCPPLYDRVATAPGDHQPTRRGCGAGTSSRRSISAATPTSSPCTAMPTASTTGSRTTA